MIARALKDHHNHLLGKVFPEDSKHSHLVQFYTNSFFLADSVGHYLASGLEQGEAAVVIALPNNINNIRKSLDKNGMSSNALETTGQLSMLDAHKILSSFMVSGQLSPTRFASEIGGILNRANQSYPRVRAYGEMVGLLWNAGHADATVQLEDLWNQLAQTHDFSLLCGYEMQSFGENSHSSDFQRICNTHSHVLPSEEYLQLKNTNAQLRRIAQLEQQAIALRMEVKRRQRFEMSLRQAVSDHHRTAKLLFSSEEFNNKIVDSIRDCIQVLDRDAKILFINQGGLKLIEADSFQKVVGTSWLDSWEGDMRVSARQVFEAAREGKVTDLTSSATTRRTQTLRYWHTVFYPIRNARGKVHQILAVSRDITEQQNLEADLRCAIRARDDLMSICSHELKTPLCSLKLQNYITKRRISKKDPLVTDPEMLLALIIDYDKQIDRLVRLVDDMLDLTRIISGKLTLHRENVEVNDFIREVLKRLSEPLRTAHCEVTVHADPNLVGFWDRFRIEQVLINLLTNAMRYGAGKPVKIIAKKLNPTTVIISVQDYGKGIAEEDQERIFQRFERATSANEVSGLGLGLYIVQQILESHSGRIFLKSTLGVGSTFSIELPISSEEAPQ